NSVVRRSPSAPADNETAHFVVLRACTSCHEPRYNAGLIQFFDPLHICMVNTPRKCLVIGNWKMHGEPAFTSSLLAGLRMATTTSADCDITVCVPFPYLYQTRSLLESSNVSWGAQDVSQHEKGAYTGEVAAAMLADFGCRWVLVGHSERRAYHGES